MTTFNTTQHLIHTLIFLTVLGPAMAEGKTQSKLKNLIELEWKNRIIVIHEIDNHSEIIKLLKQSEKQINERDIVWFLLDSRKIVSNYKHQTTAGFAQNLRHQYQLENNQVILIGKDGGLKSTFSGLDLVDIFRDIDAMPMRRAEMRPTQ